MESAKQRKKNTDIVLTRPDKGADVVVLNKADYISKMVAIFDDTYKFLKLGDLSVDGTQNKKINHKSVFLSYSEENLYRRRSMSLFVQEVRRDQECMD